jgi:hypothetical protein
MILYANNNTKIVNFTIYGERHSGTKLLKRTIETGFNIPVTWNYGWKHFFGQYHKKVSDYGINTLFFGIVRDPYDWIMAMYKKPYHVPSYISKDMGSFLFSEWMSVGKDGKEKVDPYGNIEDRNFVNGQKFKNIFELRQIKNNYLYSGMPNNTNYFLLSYEELTKDINKILSEVSELFSLKIKKLPPKIHKPHIYNIDEETQINITKNISWQIENKLGYYAKN